MIGIYKITNKINQHCYIGQSRCIEKRWKNHINTSQNVNDNKYNYPLYRAFRKYGIDNFSFEIIEICNSDELNDKEKHWIKLYSPSYNQTEGGENNITNYKLSLAQVQEIQNILILDIDGKISHKQLAEKYGVHKDTIRDINVGRSWYNENFSYPLHYTKFAPKEPIEQKYCLDCGKQISKNAKRCNQCASKIRTSKSKPPKEELKKLIREKSFVELGKIFGVSDNAIKKWCISYNLPHLKSKIKSYSDLEWEKI